MVSLNGCDRGVSPGAQRQFAHHDKELRLVFGQSPNALELGRQLLLCRRPATICVQLSRGSLLIRPLMASARLCGTGIGSPALTVGFEDELADFERKERVAARHSKDVVELWPPERALQPLKQQIIDGVEREWSDLKTLESTLTESLLQYGTGIAG